MHNLNGVGAAGKPCSVTGFHVPSERVKRDLFASKHIKSLRAVGTGIFAIHQQDIGSAVHVEHDRADRVVCQGDGIAVVDEAASDLEGVVDVKPRLGVVG